MDFSSSDYTTQFPSFWKKDVCFRCLKILHISKKKSCNQVSTSSSEHLCAHPLRLISCNGPSPFAKGAFPLEARATCSHQPSQGILKLFPTPPPHFPCLPHYPRDVYDCLGTTPAHLSHFSLCPCGGPFSPHASSLSDAVGPHFTHMKLLCEMALDKDVIYLSIPSLWVILLCLLPTWHACFVNFLSIGLSLTPNTLLPFQLTGCSFLVSAFSSVLD